MAAWAAAPGTMIVVEVAADGTTVVEETIVLERALGPEEKTGTYGTARPAVSAVVVAVITTTLKSSLSSRLLECDASCETVVVVIAVKSEMLIIILLCIAPFTTIVAVAPTTVESFATASAMASYDGDYSAKLSCTAWRATARPVFDTNHQIDQCQHHHDIRYTYQHQQDSRSTINAILLLPLLHNTTKATCKLETPFISIPSGSSSTLPEPSIHASMHSHPLLSSTPSVSNQHTMDLKNILHKRRTQRRPQCPCMLPSSSYPSMRSKRPSLHTQSPQGCLPRTSTMPIQSKTQRDNQDTNTNKETTQRATN